MNDTHAVRINAVETLHCEADWRNYHFCRVTTDEGIVGWSEFSTRRQRVSEFPSPRCSAGER